MPGGHDRGQDVAAVVADEDAVPAGAPRDRVLPVREPLLEGEERVGGALAEEHRDVEAAAVVDVPLGAVLPEEGRHVLLAGDRAVRPGAGGGALGERGVHVRGQRVGRGRGGGERGGPGGADDLLGREALGQVVPGDLGGERVEDRLALEPQLLEGAEELVAAAVAAADRAQPRVAPAVLLHPVEVADQPHQAADVMALDVGVLDVGVAAALPEPALVEGEHAVPGVEELLEALRVGGARAAPAVAVHDERHLVVRGRGGWSEDRVADLDLLGAARIRHAGQAAVGDPHVACAAGCAVGGLGGRVRGDGGQAGGREYGAERQGDLHADLAVRVVPVPTPAGPAGHGL